MGVAEVLIRGTGAGGLGLVASTVWLGGLTIVGRRSGEAVHLLVLAAILCIGTIGALDIFGLNLQAFFIGTAQRISR